MEVARNAVPLKDGGSQDDYDACEAKPEGTGQKPHPSTHLQARDVVNTTSIPLNVNSKPTYSECRDASTPVAPGYLQGKACFFLSPSPSHFRRCGTHQRVNSFSVSLNYSSLLVLGREKCQKAPERSLVMPPPAQFPEQPGFHGNSPRRRNTSAGIRAGPVLTPGIRRSPKRLPSLFGVGGILLLCDVNWLWLLTRIECVSRPAIDPPKNAEEAAWPLVQVSCKI